MFADKKRFLALLGLNLITFTAFIDFTIVNVALPNIQQNLAIPTTQLQWIINIYFIMISISMITMGKLGDIFGVPKLFLLSSGLFTIASLICGIAVNADVLLIGRLLQGLAAACIFPLGAAAVALLFTEENERNQAMSFYGGINGLGIAVGPTLGGVIVALLSWRWVFLINVPINLIGLLISLKYFKVSEIVSEKINIDLKGMLLLGIAIICLNLGFINATHYGWENVNSWMYFLFFAIALPLLIVIENRQQDPIIHLDFFTRPHFLAGIILCSTGGALLSVVLFFNPLFLSVIQQHSPIITGLILFAIPLMTMLAPIVLSQIMKYVKKIWLTILSLIFTLIAGFLLITFDIDTSITIILFTFILIGSSWGIVNVVSALIAQETAAPNEMGVITGTVYTSFNIAASIALALATTIFELMERNTANKLMLENNIQLSPTQQSLFKTLLTNPEHALQQLSQFGETIAAQVVSIFKVSFTHGFHSAMWVIIVYSLLGLLAMWPIGAKILKYSEKKQCKIFK